MRRALEPFLSVTSKLVIATGILSVWEYEPEDLQPVHADLNAAYGGRFVLGLGVSHSVVVDRRGRDGRYGKPLTKMRGWLEANDALPSPIPPEGMTLVALRPKMLALSAERTLGAHPYFVPPEHTAKARDLLGPDAVLAPEQTVVLETDPAKAREVARGFTSTYLRLPNYVNNLLELGFGVDELADGGSDRVVDALVAWG